MAVAKYWSPSLKTWLPVNSVEIRFYNNDTIAYYSIPTQFPLSYIPIPHSERLFKNGVYQRETVTWTRDPESLIVKFLPAMGLVIGDHISVDYAYQVGGAG